MYMCICIHTYIITAAGESGLGCRPRARKGRLLAVSSLELAANGPFVVSSVFADPNIEYVIVSLLPMLKKLSSLPSASIPRHTHGLSKCFGIPETYHACIASTATVAYTRMFHAEILRGKIMAHPLTS